MFKRMTAVFATIAVFTLAATVFGPTAEAGNGPLAELTGQAECTEPGTYTITWTIELLAGFPGEVESAVLSGAAEGNIADSFEPNPFEFDDDETVGTSVVSGDTVGTVTLDALLIFEVKGSLDFELSADVELDGSCEAPPTTEESTTTTAATQPAAEVRPTFTG